MILLPILLLLASQEPKTAPDRTFGWTKAGLYMASSVDRPFRIFLNPEMDFSPYGTYLPEWKRLFPAKDGWDFNKEPRFHILANQVRMEGDAVLFYVVRERYAQNPWYEQWYGFYDLKSGTLRALRWGSFNFSGEPIEFKDFAGAGGMLLDANQDGWREVASYLKEEPAREAEQRKLILKLMHGEKAPAGTDSRKKP